jgi:hypothetical protein
MAPSAAYICWCFFLAFFCILMLPHLFPAPARLKSCFLHSCSPSLSRPACLLQKNKILSLSQCLLLIHSRCLPQFRSSSIRAQKTLTAGAKEGSGMEIVKPVERQMTNKEVQAMGKLVVKGEDAAMMPHVGSHTVRRSSRFRA